MSYHAVGENAFDLFTKRLEEFRTGKVSPPEGASKSTINWWCWGHPGFQDCHKLSFQAAQHQCASAGTPDDPECLVLTSDRLSKAGCPCPPAPPPSGMSEGTKTGLIVVLVAAVGIWALLPERKKKVSA